MALSPADFAAYSRAIGAPYPESPEERALLVPEVRAFRQNQLQAQPKQESETTALGFGIGLGLAALGGGAMALRGRVKKGAKKDVAGKSSVKMTDLSNQQASDVVETSLLPVQTKAGVYERVKRKFPDVPGEQELTRAYAPEARRAEAHAEKFGYADLNPAERKLTNPETGEIYSRGRSPDVPQSKTFLADPAVLERRQRIQEINEYPDAPRKSNRPLGGPLAIVDDKGANDAVQASRQLARKQYANLLLDEKVEQLLQDLQVDVRREAGQMTGSESNRQSAIVRRIQAEEERQAKNILSELAQETPTLVESYDLVGEPRAAVQSLDAVQSSSDQADARFESIVQRDVDSVKEGKAVIAAETVAAFGPVTAQDTADRALAQMIQLRQDIYNQSSQPNTVRTKSGKLRIVPVDTVRAERQLAERFKTGETSKIGELGITGKSLEQVTLPAGPMRQTMQSVETFQSPTMFSRSVENIGGNPSSDLTKAASGSSIRGRSRIQNEPEQFRQRVDSSGRRIDDEFGVELTELDLDTGESKFSRQVVDPVTKKLTPEYAPKGQRVVQLYQGKGQPTKSMYVPESDPGGIGIYGEERSFASGPISKFGENTGQYTKTAQRKPTELPYPQKKGGDLTDMSTTQLQNFASNAVKQNPKAAQNALNELERRETSKLSMQASEAVRRANIEGRDPQQVLRSMGFGV